MKNFKRKEIESETYLRKLIHYIHDNPVQAGFCGSPLKYRYSSYQAILSKKPTKIEREEVINIFEDRENFVYVHHKPAEITGIAGF